MSHLCMFVVEQVWCYDADMSNPWHFGSEYKPFIKKQEIKGTLIQFEPHLINRCRDNSVNT